MKNTLTKSELAKKYNVDLNKLTDCTYHGSIKFGSLNIDNLLEFNELGIKKVVGDFNCSGNNLITLDGCPEIVYGDFLCWCNPLKNLNIKCKIGGHFQVE